MRFTILADDKSVGVDGVFFAPVDLSQLDTTVHAVQWYGAHGEVEYKVQTQDGRSVKPDNASITDAGPYMFAVAAWEAARQAAVAAEKAAHEPPGTEP